VAAAAAAPSPALAQPQRAAVAVNARAEVAMALYAASATQAAFERAADARLRTAQAEIARLKGLASTDTKADQAMVLRFNTAEADWKSRLAAAEKQIGALSEDLGRYRARIASLESDLGACGSARASLQDEVERLRAAKASQPSASAAPLGFAAVAGADIASANSCLAAIYSRFQAQIREQFNAQRKTHNEELHPTGGSPTNDSVWTLFQSRHLKGAKGKFVFNQLKNVIPGNAYRESSFTSALLNVELAADLQFSLSGLLGN
jgi:hypothetical protein